MSQQETVLYPCNECKRFYNSLKSLKKHNTKTHAAREFGCFECKKFYIQERVLQKHFKDVHPGKDMNDQDCGNEILNVEKKKNTLMADDGKSNNKCIKISTSQISNSADKKIRVIEEAIEGDRKKERGFIYSLSEKYILDLLKAENEWVMRGTKRDGNVDSPYYV